MTCRLITLNFVTFKKKLKSFKSLQSFDMKRNEIQSYKYFVFEKRKSRVFRKNKSFLKECFEISVLTDITASQAFTIWFSLTQRKVMSTDTLSHLLSDDVVRWELLPRRGLYSFKIWHKSEFDRILTEFGRILAEFDRILTEFDRILAKFGQRILNPKFRFGFRTRILIEFEFGVRIEFLKPKFAQAYWTKAVLHVWRNHVIKLRVSVLRLFHIFRKIVINKEKT